MKKNVALVFALAVTIASLVEPATALAADFLLVDGVVARPLNQQAEVFEGNGWSYDGGDELVLDGYNGGGIRFGGQLNITLRGSNTISGTVEEYDKDNAGGYWLEGNPFWGGMPELLIKGGGSLTIDLDDVDDPRVSSGSGIDTYEGHLVIDGASIAVRGGERFGSNGSGVSVYGLELRSGASASISRGLEIAGWNDAVTIEDYGALIVNDSTLEVAAAANPAIYVAGHVTAQDSVIRAMANGAEKTTFLSGGGFSFENEVGDTTSAKQEDGWVIESAGSEISISPGNVDIAKAMVSVGDQVYTGKALTPKPSITYSGQTLTLGKDYSLSYKDNVNAGTASISIIGKGAFTGSTSATFVINPADISNAVVTAPDQVYDGGAKVPAVAVSMNGRALTSNVDYVAPTRSAYSNNVNAGVAAVSIVGRGNYSGTATGSFKINPADIADARVMAASQVYDGTEKRPVPTVRLSSGVVRAAYIDVAYENNVQEGTATVIVTGKNNYTGSARGTFEIVNSGRILSTSVGLKRVTVFDTQSYEIVMGPGKAIRTIKLSISEREEVLTSKDGRVFSGSWYVSRDADDEAYSIYLSGQWEPEKIVIEYADGNTAAVYDARGHGYPVGSVTADLSGLNFTFVDVNPDVVPVYRLYNRKTSEHLYTLNKGEYDQLPKITKGDWVQEGIAWYAPKTSKTPVYRLYNKKSGDHHYTTNPRERDALVDKHGWTSEGIAFYSDDAKTLPLFRLYNGRLMRGQHHYTASVQERDALTSRHGWKGEGIGFYGVGK